MLWLSKNVNIKKCAPKPMFFNEKKTRKIPLIFDFETQIFALFDNSGSSQSTIISFL